MISDKMGLGLFILDILAWCPDFYSNDNPSKDLPTFQKRSLPVTPSVVVVRSNVVAVNVAAPNFVISSNPIF